MAEPVFNTSSSNPQQRQSGGTSLFRRAEDWERLTRLEFLVEEVIRDNERRDERIEAIVNAQEKISNTQQTVICQLRRVQNLVTGALIGICISALGLDKVLNVLIGLAG